MYIMCGCNFQTYIQNIYLHWPISIVLDYAQPPPHNQGSSGWLLSTASRRLWPAPSMGPGNSQSQSHVEAFHMTSGSGFARVDIKKTYLKNGCVYIFLWAANLKDHQIPSELLLANMYIVSRSIYLTRPIPTYFQVYIYIYFNYL